MSDRFGARIPAYRLEETELHLLQMSGEETDWSYTPVPTLSKTSLLSYFFIDLLFGMAACLSLYDADMALT